MATSEAVLASSRSRAVLTDARARALKPGDVRQDVPDGRVPGLFLSVLPSGLKQWTLRYRTQGKQRRLVLGEFGAARHGISRTKLRYWLRRVDGSLGSTPVTFVPVQMSSPEAESSAIEVVCGPGERVIVRAGASADLLRLVLAAIRSTC